jgi:hypothetical protein
MREKGKRGFALILTLFLVLALTSAAAASFLNSGRRSRTAVKTVDHVQMTWAGEALIERSIQMFYDYVRAAGFPSAVSGSSPAQVVDSGEVLGADATKPFGYYLGVWYTAFVARHPEVAGITLVPANSQVPDVLVDVIDLSPTVKATGADYEVTIRLKYENLGETRVYSQKIHVANGRLFDFGVFYDKDIEIAAGPDWTLQGPIFTNGNVYLMTGQNHTLTLTAPPSGGPENYVLNAGGTIYYYYKTAIAKNYLMNNSFYYNVYPHQDATYAFYTGAPLPDARLAADQHLNDLNGKPLYAELAVGVVGGEMYPIYNQNQPYNYVFSNEGVYGASCSGYNCWANSSTINVVDADKSTYPLWQGSNWNNDEVYEVAPLYDDRYFPGDPSYHNPMVLTAFGLYSPASPYPHLSTSVALTIDPGNSQKLGTPRKLYPDWTPQNLHADLAPRNDKYWHGLASTSGKLLVMDQVPKKLMPVGAPNITLHTLIEPLALNGDEDGNGTTNDNTDVLIRKFKYQTYANVVLKCVPVGDSPCGAYDANLVDSTNWDGHTYPVPFRATGSLNFLLGTSTLALSSFYDYRLQETHSMLTIDVGQLQSILADNYNLKQVVLYVETNPLNSAKHVNRSKAPDMVRLKNGSQLPEQGLSVITNGRLWVQGDYNTFSYSSNHVATECTSFSDIINAVNPCLPPPADLYSDSFGVLSKDWSSDGFTDISNRKVTHPLILNVGIITGTLPSQLIIASYVNWNSAAWSDHPRWAGPISLNLAQYVDPATTQISSACTGTDSDGFTNGFTKFSNCFQVYGSSAYDVGSYQEIWKGPGYESAPPTYKSPTFCPQGLDSGTGAPVDPANCFYTRDPDTGIFYWNSADMSASSSGWKSVVAQGAPPPASPPASPSLYYQWAILPDYTPDLSATYTNCSRNCLDWQGWPWESGSWPTTDFSGCLSQPPCPGGGCDAQGYNCSTSTNTRDGRRTYLAPSWATANNAYHTIPLVAVATAGSQSSVMAAPGYWGNYFPVLSIPQGTPEYPGIPFNSLYGYINSSLQYGCIRDSKWTNGLARQTSCCPGGEGTCQPSCPPVTNGSSQYLNCHCDDPSNGKIYSRFQAPVPPSIIPTIMDPSTALTSFPSSWSTTSPNQFLNSSVCPDPKDNMFYQQPSLFYGAARYLPLYEPRYSGGLENLINLQEDWLSGSAMSNPDGTKIPFSFHFYGVLIVPWDSTELYTSTGLPAPLDKTPALYNKGYYMAPTRDYNYNGGLRTNRTPVTVASNQQTFAISRRQFSEKSGS